MSADNNEKNKQLNRNAKILLVIAGLFTIAIGLSNIFVNVYIWRIEGNFVSIGLYNLFINIFSPLTFILAGYISKIKEGTISLRTGIILHAIFFVIVLILRENAVNYLTILGSFLGIAAGFYWLAFHVLTFDLTNNKNRDSFYSYNGMIDSLSGMLAPLTGGFIISRMEELTGYYIVFGISFIIFVIIIIISLFLQTDQFKDKFNLGYIFSNSNQSWKSMMKANFFFGIRTGVLIFLINLLIFIVLGDEFSIGKFMMLGAVISAISFEFIEKIMKPEKRKLFIIIGSIMLFIAVFPIGIKISLISVLIFVILNSFFKPFLNVPLNAAAYNIIDNCEQENARIEYIIYKEIILNLGRIVGIIGFIFITDIAAETFLKIFIIFIGSVQLFIPLLIKGINQDTEVL